MAVKVIHFGYFLRSRRIANGWTIKKMASEAKLTEPRIVAYEKMPEPVMYDSSFGRVAAALGVEPDELDQAWRVTPVEPPRERRRPLVVRFEIDEPSHAALTRLATDAGQRPADTARELMLEALAARAAGLPATRAVHLPATQ